MTKERDALKLALNFIEQVDYPPYDDKPVITAIREALAQPQEKYQYGTPLLDAMTGKASEALDRMAENARELGLDYETAQKPVAYRCWNNAQNADGTFDALHIWVSLKPEGYGNEPLYTSPQPAQQQEPLSRIDVACDIKTLCATGDLPDSFEEVAEWVAAGAMPSPPPECKTDAEKTAFAFGWWKALEENRKQPAPQEPVAYSYTSRITGAQGFSHHPMPRFIDSESWDIKPLYTFSQPSKPCQGIPRKGCDYLAPCDHVCNKCGNVHHHHQMVANFTATQPSKPLTDEEIWDEVKAADLDWQTGWSLDEDASNRYITFARAIEAAHGIKGDA